MTAAEETGPGIISTDDVGVLSMAKTQVLTTRFTMAFAASISDANPAYYDDLSPEGVSIHPGVAFSLQWASRFRPDRKLNLRAAPFGVHASTDLRLQRPFRPGEAITTQGQIVQKRQIKPGVFALDRYRMTGSDGQLVAELDYNGITRGGTLDGPAVAIADEDPQPTFANVADEPLWRKEFFIGLHACQQYTECAQIYNPIHTEPSVARAAGLPDIILHGSATKAISLSAVIDECFGGDARRIVRLCGQLRGMVLPNTTIAVECLAEQTDAGEKQVLFRTLNGEGQLAVSHGIVCGRATE